MSHRRTMYPFKFHAFMTELIREFMTEYRSHGMAPSLVRTIVGSPITYKDNVPPFFSASL